MKENSEFKPQDLWINFRDLFLYVLLRWRSILVVALAGAVLLCGVKYLKDFMNYKNDAGTAAVDESELDVDAKAHVALAIGYRGIYEKHAIYNANALYMKIDADAVPTWNLSYIIAGEDSYAVASLYRKHLSSQNLYEGLTGQMEQEDDEYLSAYLAELVSFSLDYESNDAPSEKVFLDIKVVAPTQELCGQVTDLMRESMNSLLDEVTASTGTHISKLVYDHYAVRLTESVRTFQQNSLRAQDNALKDLEEAEGQLTAAEKEYLNQLTNGENAAPAAPPSVSKKFIVLGFLLGGVLMVAWYALRYIFCGRVMSESDVALRYGVHVFGSLASDKKRFFIDRWLLNWLQDKSAQPSLMQRQIALVAKAAESRAVYAIGGEGVADHLPDLAKELQTLDISLQTGDGPLASDEGVAGMAAADAVLLVKQTGVSTHKEIVRELALAEQLGQKVLGVVLLK